MIKMFVRLLLGSSMEHFPPRHQPSPTAADNDNYVGGPDLSEAAGTWAHTPESSFSGYSTVFT